MSYVEWTAGSRGSMARPIPVPRSPVLGAGPNGGVELEGSKWSVETLSVPNSYSGKGFQGSEKAALPCRSGTYTFRVTYKDGNDQATALGTLTIPQAGSKACIPE